MNEIFQWIVIGIIVIVVMAMNMPDDTPKPNTKSGGAFCR